MAQHPFYVYSLKDPRTKPSKPFYIRNRTGTLSENRNADAARDCSKRSACLVAAGLNPSTQGSPSIAG
jgi:hypothetical protein